MEINTDIEKEVLRKFTLPLNFDKEGGYIFDAKNEMVAQVRGWGYLQKFDNGIELQDTLGEMIVKAFNEKYNK